MSIKNEFIMRHLSKRYGLTLDNFVEYVTEGNFFEKIESLDAFPDLKERLTPLINVYNSMLIDLDLMWVSVHGFGDVKFNEAVADYELKESLIQERITNQPLDKILYMNKNLVIDYLIVKINE